MRPPVHKQIEEPARQRDICSLPLGYLKTSEASLPLWAFLITVTLFHSVYSPKNENFVTYSPSCCFKSVRVSSFEHKRRYFEECWWQL